jgi:hypothetical protein
VRETRARSDAGRACGPPRGASLPPVPAPAGGRAAAAPGKPKDGSRAPQRPSFQSPIKLAADVWNSIVFSFGRVILTDIPPVTGLNTSRVVLVWLRRSGRGLGEPPCNGEIKFAACAIG